MYWPIALAVFADVFYQICSKSTPVSLNPFASLTITYLVGAALSALIFFMTGGGNLLAEWKEINWTTFVLGLAIVGHHLGNPLGVVVAHIAQVACHTENEGVTVAMLGRSTHLLLEGLYQNTVGDFFVLLREGIQ